MVDTVDTVHAPDRWFEPCVPPGRAVGTPPDHSGLTCCGWVWRWDSQEPPLRTVTSTPSTAVNNMDPMLMEALMLFSSEESDIGDSGSDALRQPTITGIPAAREPRPPTATPNVAEKLTAPPSVRATPSPQPQQPRRRNRSSKCTYASRREEVARLRTLTSQLDTELRELKEDLHRRQQLARQHAQHEQSMLNQSQSENARLKSLIADCEAKIAALQEQSLESR
jgi:hypothetical protein